MLHSILVPLDGSPLAETALVIATALSIPTGAKLVLVRAVLTHTLPGVDARSTQTEAQQDAATYLAATARSLEQRGFACETATPYGTPNEWLPEEAHMRHADLITMSTHGRTGPGRWLFGSVAESVVANSPVPVLIERAWQSARREPFLADVPRLLVPLDGSPFSETALGPAAALCEDLGAELTLLRAEPWPTDVIADDNGRTVAYVDRQEEWARVDALAYLDGVANRLVGRYPGLSVRTQVRMGGAAEGIVEVSDGGDFALVVMATHGRTGIRRTLLGSVAGKVLEAGVAPLVLVGPAVEVSQDGREQVHSTNGHELFPGPGAADPLVVDTQD